VVRERRWRARRRACCIRYAGGDGCCDLVRVGSGGSWVVLEARAEIAEREACGSARGRGGG
jgi:hypothetical protein